VITLGLGCAPIGNMFETVTDDEAIAVVHAAYDAGIRLFDTAPLYGHGLSEIRLGRALASLPRDELTISTKVGRLLVAGEASDTIFQSVPEVQPMFDFSADGAHRSLEASLGRLGLDRVDIVHVHDPDDRAEEALAGAFPALLRWRDEGVVKKIGAGMNQSALLTRFVREVDIDCVLLAGRYTVLEQPALEDLLPLCEATGTDVIAAGVFNSGLLADPRPGAHYDYALAPPDLIERAQHLASICERHGVPLTAAALQFPARHPAVSTVLTGARSVAELQDNVAGSQLPIPQSLWDELDAMSSRDSSRRGPR
jgi:D-threo-aldose 1-dehydrogenase